MFESWWARITFIHITMELRFSVSMFKRSIAIIIAIVILLFAGVSVYIKYYGKNLIEDALTSALEKDVNLENVFFQFPLGLKVQNVRIMQSTEGGELFAAKDIYVQMSPDTIYQRQLIFDSVTFVEPLAVIGNTSKLKSSKNDLEQGQGSAALPQYSDLAGEAKTTSKKDQNKKSEVSVKQLILKQGTFKYVNNVVNKDFSFSVEDVYLKAKQLTFPVSSGQTNFNLTGRLVKEGNPLSGSLVEGSGWVDINNRNMAAKVEVVEADGSIGMTAEAISENNDMKVTGEVKFQDIFEKSIENDSSETSTINNLISSALSSAGVEIGARFSFNTKMDDFSPEKISFSGRVVTR